MAKRPRNRLKSEIKDDIQEASIRFIASQLCRTAVELVVDDYRGATMGGEVLLIDSNGSIDVRALRAAILCKISDTEDLF